MDEQKAIYIKQKLLRLEARVKDATRVLKRNTEELEDFIKRHNIKNEN